MNIIPAKAGAFTIKNQNRYPQSMREFARSLTQPDGGMEGLLGKELGPEYYALAMADALYSKGVAFSGGGFVGPLAYYVVKLLEAYRQGGGLQVGLSTSKFIWYLQVGREDTVDLSKFDFKDAPFMVYSLIEAIDEPDYNKRFLWVRNTKMVAWHIRRITDTLDTVAEAKECADTL